MAGRSNLQKAARPAAAPAVRRRESPLDWLRSRKDAEGRPAINESEYDAGVRLRDEFERALRMRATTVDWDRFGGAGRASGSSGDGFSEIGAAARARLDAAFRAAGAGLAEILLLVCCREMGLSEAEAQLGWPKRSAKIVLKIALGRLAIHYGLARAPMVAPFRAWIDEEVGADADLS